MDFQRRGKQDNAGRFERGCLKVTTENLTSWNLPGREKPPETNFRDALNIPQDLRNVKPFPGAGRNNLPRGRILANFAVFSGKRLDKQE